MAKLKIQDPAIDATVAIGGGTLLANLVGQVPMVADLLANLPADLAGIDVQLWVLGATALVVYKNYIMK
jgi:hypothetical protein